MKNLAFRLADDGNFKLRYTYVNTNGELDLERSFFQLKVLADFLNDNPTHKITLFTTKYADEEFGSSQYSSALVQVKNFLINEGITGRVEIEDTITVVTNDALGKFRMAYRMSR